MFPLHAAPVQYHAVPQAKISCRFFAIRSTITFRGSRDRATHLVSFVPHFKLHSPKALHSQEGFVHDGGRDEREPGR
jgi:hypothetical protein